MLLLNIFLHFIGRLVAYVHRYKAIFRSYVALGTIVQLNVLIQCSDLGGNILCFFNVLSRVKCEKMLVFVLPA